MAKIIRLETLQQKEARLIAGMHDGNQLAQDKLYDYCADYYYENPKEGQVYIDLVLNFTNNSKKELPVSKICSLSAKTKKGKRYRCSWFTTEIEKGTRLSSQVSIASGETAKLHCTLSVPDKKETFLLSLKFEDTVYEMEYKLGQEITPAVSIDSSSQDLAEFEPAILSLGAVVGLSFSPR